MPATGRLLVNAADAELDRADQAVREQYAILCGNIARREHERLVHDTVLNTLTSVARSGGDAVADLLHPARLVGDKKIRKPELAPRPACRRP